MSTAGGVYKVCNTKQGRNKKHDPIFVLQETVIFAQDGVLLLYYYLHCLLVSHSHRER